MDRDDFFHQNQDLYILHNILNTKPVLAALKKNLIENKWNLVSSDTCAIAKFSKNNKILGVNLVHCDKIDSDFLVTDSICHNIKTSNKVKSLAPTVFGNYFYDFKYTNQMPTKLYNCFIRRCCSTRQSWLFFLIRKKLLSQGHVTFWCENREAQSNKMNEQAFFEHCYQNNKSVFFEEYKQFKQNYSIPFKNFNFDIETAIIDSQKTLTIETYFNSHDELSIFSEKTWRTIQLPRPFLFFSTPNNVKLLREWGFEVYDDFIDHSYDQEQDWIKRQSMILNQLATPINYTESVLNDFEQRAQHNRNLLKSYKKQWPGFFSEFLEQIKIL